MKNNKVKGFNKPVYIFIKSEIIWTIIVLSFFLFGIIINYFDFQWIYNLSPNIYFQVDEWFYKYLTFIHRPFLGPIIWLLGFIFIFYKYVKKSSKYYKEIEKAIEDVMNKQVEFIELPTELEEIQTQINQLKYITEKNKKIVEEEQQRKNDLIVYLAHDIKTPLTSMIGYLSLLDEVKNMPKKQREKYLKITLEKSYRLEELINELFDIARFNSENIILEKENLNLNLMLEQIIDDFYPTLNELDKKIILNIKEKIKIEADSDKLARVFNNIIKNAIYYSNENTDIMINVKKKKEFVDIEIINKGPKIPKEKLNKIFEKFYRMDSSRNSRNGGSGLGLAIAKEIVEMHNGFIKVSSNEKETIFYITLPINDLCD